MSTWCPESNSALRGYQPCLGKPALDYHLPSSLLHQSGWRDSNSRSCVPKTHGLPLPYIPSQKSERADLNRRSPAPGAGAITRLRYVLILSSSCGSRTRLCALKGRYPKTDRRTNHLYGRTFHADEAGISERISRSGLGGARIRVSWFSARCYTVSATSPTKKPRVASDTGLRVFVGNSYGQVSGAQWIGGLHIRRRPPLRGGARSKCTHSFSRFVT